MRASGYHRDGGRQAEAGTMLDHIGLAVADFARANDFYAAALAPLGIARLRQFAMPAGSAAGFGAGDRPFFWIGDGKAPGQGAHVAFAAADRAAVDAFHAAAMAAGGRDNGAPGLRPQYHPDYYAAFVLDPEGNNIEAVCRAPG
jgi:catechol 2,3-dioxygenase-like lactoylglutathione lyase family enzyme